MGGPTILGLMTTPLERVSMGIYTPMDECSRDEEASKKDNELALKFIKLDK